MQARRIVQSLLDAASRDAAAPAFIDDYLAYLLARASHLISAEFHVVVRRTRLPVLQWRVLATLADSQVSSIGEVADIVLVPQSTLTRVAARMVQGGLLLRAEDAQDRRITRVRLSAKGLKLAARLVAQARSHEAAVVGALGAQDAATLKRILRRLIEQHAGAPA
ncbi:MAG: MarR family transcriptional regulator [Burkholderiaceae bacterium]|jgi:DNA-binding MarR family transcriptional regulator|nr:MarR family transcriptional regulator [Burkholderiaceae bacterium]MCU0964472.1 MarR family transcriptional regulator [Burkholderiaceae bacterium]